MEHYMFTVSVILLLVAQISLSFSDYLLFEELDWYTLFICFMLAALSMPWMLLINRCYTIKQKSN
jgi:hypothetical protein